MSFLGGLLGLVGTFINSKSNEASASQTNNTNLQLAREADQRNMELWHQTNAYNSPLEQRKRLEAAGLNPGLMYGSLDNTAGLPADSNVPTATPPVSPDYSGALSQIGDSLDPVNRQIKEQQLRSITLDNDNKDPSNPDSEVSVRKENTKQHTKYMRTQETKMLQDMDLAIKSDKRAQEKHDAEMKELAIKTDTEALDYSRKQYAFDEYKSNRSYRDAIQKAELVLKQQGIALNANELRQQAEEYANIETQNYDLAQYYFFKDNIYPELIRKGKSQHSGFASFWVDNKNYRFWNKEIDKYSPEDIWYDGLSQSEREAILNSYVRQFHRYNNDKRSFNTKKYSNFMQYYEDVAVSGKYHNLAYRKYDTNSLGKATNKAFQSQTTIQYGNFKMTF